MAGNVPTSQIRATNLAIRHVVGQVTDEQDRLTAVDVLLLNAVAVLRWRIVVVVLVCRRIGAVGRRVKVWR